MTEEGILSVPWEPPRMTADENGSFRRQLHFPHSTLHTQSLNVHGSKHSFPFKHLEEAREVVLFRFFGAFFAEQFPVFSKRRHQNVAFDI